MIKDKFLNFYVTQIEKERSRLREEILDCQSLTLEELRRIQGIYYGLQKALDLLDDALDLDKEDK